MLSSATSMLRSEVTGVGTPIVGGTAVVGLAGVRIALLNVVATQSHVCCVFPSRAFPLT